MNYSFCNLEVEIRDNPSSFLQNYDNFRHENCSSPNIIYTCVEDKNLTLPNNIPVFECMPGTKVYELCENCFEYYYEIHNRLICKLTKEHGENVLYYRVEENRIFTELDLINSLYLDNVMSEKGRFLLHSSFVRTKYGAVLFTAPSGTGKSTQAELWRQYRNAEVLNGDRTCIWEENGTWMAGGALWCGTSGIMKNEICPLAAVVVLKQGPVNKLSPMSMISKIKKVMEQTTINVWDYQMYNRVQEFCINLCSNIPVLELTCTPDERAVQMLEKELEKLC